MIMFLKKPVIYPACLAAIVSVTACSSHIPPEIKQPIAGSPEVSEVRHNADAYLSQKVRWGGIIVDTTNRENASELTIVSLPLQSDGKPRDSDNSPGRFIAVIDQFIEPTLYSPNRKITITGRVVRSGKLKVGEFMYNYPVIQAEHYYLWPEEPEQIYIDSPPYWWYDPYYPWRYPYYPYHPY